MIEGVLPAFELRYESCRCAYEAAVGKRRACVRACEDENSELEPAQGDASRWSCGVAGAVESGLQVRRSCVCTRAVVQRAGGEQSAADTARQEEFLAGRRSIKRDVLLTGRFTHRLFLRSGSGAEEVVSKLEMLNTRGERRVRQLKPCEGFNFLTSKDPRRDARRPTYKVQAVHGNPH